MRQQPGFTALPTLSSQIPIMDTSAGGRSAAFAKLPRFLRFLRLIRLMRLMRVMKIRRLMDQWEEVGVMANTVWRVFRMLFSMVVRHARLGTRARRGTSAGFGWLNRPLATFLDVDGSLWRT